MRKYLGFEYNEAGKLVESYAYTITPAELETIENMVLYYEHHGVKKMLNTRPEFVIEDFEKVLAILNTIITWEV